MPGRDIQVKQVRLSDVADDDSQIVSSEPVETPLILPMLDIGVEEMKSTKFWAILVETVKRNPLYPNLAAYAWNNILNANPSISPKELAGQLSISLGEALVIIDEYYSQNGR